MYECMLTIRIGINGRDIRILGAHNTGKERGHSTVYDVYRYDLQGNRNPLPFATVLHEREDGAEVLAGLVIKKFLKSL